MSVKRFIPATKDNFVADIMVNIVEGISNTTVSEDKSYDGILGYDVDNFIDDLYDFLTNYQKTTQEFKDFSLKPEYGYHDVSSDESNSIRYKILLETPSGLSRESEPHKGIKAHKWMLVDILEDKNNPGYQVLLYQKPVDVTIEIASWSKNYRDANRGAKLIKDILETYKRIFINKGLQLLRFEGRKEDLIDQKANTVSYGAPLVYYLRTVEVKTVYEKILENISIELATHRTHK